MADVTPAFRIEPQFSVLLVCTGNICRSAFAERLGRAYLADALGAEAGRVRLASAGTRAVVDASMHPDTVQVLQRYGGGAPGFAAPQVTARMVEDADLTLTMTRDHRREVLEVAPRALARTFTVREAAALLDRVDGDDPPGAGFADRATQLVHRMAKARSGRPGCAGDD